MLFKKVIGYKFGRFILILPLIWGCITLIKGQMTKANILSVSALPIVESEHPYANNENAFWVINNNSGMNAARIFFSQIELEEGVDKIEIRDQNETLIQVIDTSAPTGMWSDIVPGNLIKVVLQSDSSGRFWGFAVEQVEFLNYSTLAYSPHPYPNSYDDVKTLLNPTPNPAGTRLQFDRIELEEDVDYLIIADENDNPYQWITGTHLAGFTSKAVPGAVIKLQLITDGSGQEWGYNLHNIETLSPNSPDLPPMFPVALAESNHPYGHHVDQTWTLVNPNTNATSSKIHFSRIDLETNYDFIYILNENDTVIQTITGHHTDFWSDYVPGRVVKVQLITNGCCVADWGFRVDAIVDSISKPGLVQSDHFYGHNLNQTWSLVNPNINADSSKIHFSRIDLETNYDFIYILNENDTVIQTITGHHTDFWSDYVPGRVVKVRLTTNGCCVRDWGFRVDDIVDSIKNPGLAQSHHPYDHNLDQIWTLVNPNINAVSSRVHFSRIDLETNFDFVRILDENDTIIQTITGHYNDLWSDNVPGRVVKIQLTTNGCCVKDWGFRVDDIFPDSDEPIPRAFVSGIYVTVLYPGTVYLNGVEQFYAEIPGEYKILLPDVGAYTIHIEYLEYTQDILVTVDDEGNLDIIYLPLMER